MSKPRRRRREMVQGDLADVSGATRAGFDVPVPKLAFLDAIDRLVDWESVRAPLLDLYAAHGRPGTDPLLLVKMMLLQRLFALSDPQCEMQCNDRRSFARFVGLRGGEAAPDETTLVRFRARLAAAGLATGPVDEIMNQLEAAGYVVQEGRSVIVDGSLIPAQTNRGATHENNEPVEPDATTQGRSDWKPPVHGYKMHVALDAATGLVLGETVTSATGDERAQLEVLVVPGDKELLADKGLASRAVDRQLREKKVKNGVMRKKPRGGRLNEYQRRRNQAIQARRGRIEGVFGQLKNVMGLRRAAYRGLAKVAALVRWTLVAYNLRRLDRLGWPAAGGRPAERAGRDGP